jgi:1-acyl-sn-glycerol-3-phosphate acyltransferase
MSSASKSASGVVKPSKHLLTLFDFYLRWYIGRHFHGLRVAHGERFLREVQGPTIVYLNHPSWWDPLTCMMLAQRFLPTTQHYGPMDEAALKRYRFFSKLGLFPVELNTARGAIQFLRSATEIVSTSNSVLWLTPQGCFDDVRRLPLTFKDGLGALLSRLPEATCLPIAIEYVFWDEPLPEILVNIGNPIRISNRHNTEFAEFGSTLTEALSATQQELAVLAIGRDAGRFEPILDGGAGIGGVYELWQRVRSGLRGERYRPEHGSIHRP